MENIPTIGEMSTQTPHEEVTNPHIKLLNKMITEYKKDLEYAQKRITCLMHQNDFLSEDLKIIKEKYTKSCKDTQYFTQKYHTANELLCSLGYTIYNNQYIKTQ